MGRRSWRPLVPLAVLLAGSAACAPTGGAPSTVPPADHHAHVWSERARDARARIEREVLGRKPGELAVVDGADVVASLDSAGVGRAVLVSTAYFFGIPDIAFDSAAERARDARARIEREVLGREPGELAVVDAADVVASLDSAGVGRAVLVSTAYFFGIPDIAFDSAAERTRAENDWVAAEGRRYPDRLVAFFGANPLAPYAVDELDHCVAVAECAGFKLQLANSDVDFRDTAHVRGLRDFFAAANARGLPVIVHLETRRPDFGARDVDAFVDRVLPAAPDIPIQVAHLGGNGQYDDATRRSIDAFLTAFRDHPDRTANVFFDMAVVPLPESLAGGDEALVSTIRELNRAFVATVRELGPDRVVFGSDFPEISIAGYLDGLRTALPVDSAERVDLLDDAAPYLR